MEKEKNWSWLLDDLVGVSSFIVLYTLLIVVTVMFQNNFDDSKRKIDAIEHHVSQIQNELNIMLEKKMCIDCDIKKPTWPPKHI